MVKNLPIVDIAAPSLFFRYDIDTTKKNNYEEVTIMRHVYIRGILSLIWVVAGVVSGISGNFEMTALYLVLGGVFLYSAYATWKKEKNKGGR